MIICPIAIAVGCKKCPAFSFCPLTTVLGDQQKEDEVNAFPMTSAHERDDIWEDKSSGSAKADRLDWSDDDRDLSDEYRRYAKEELEKNKKEESENE